MSASDDQPRRPRHTRRSSSPLEDGLPEPSQVRSWAQRIFGVSAAVQNDDNSSEDENVDQLPDPESSSVPNDSESVPNDSDRIDCLEQQLTQQGDMLAGIWAKLNVDSAPSMATAAVSNPVPDCRGKNDTKHFDTNREVE
jgi:hypothetical protein